MAAPKGRGLFIAFEGVEGSGKSTQVELLADWLEGRRLPHLLAREPGGTAVGEEIRKLLLEGEDVPARAELLLMLAARAAFVDALVRPALEAGTIVVADRYDLSTLAYQGHGRGLPLDDVRALNAFATDGVRPDLTLVLDVSVETGEARRARAGQGPDRIERAGRDFHERVAGAYRLLAEAEPAVERIDGTEDAAAVHAEVRRRLRARFPETFSPPAG